MIDEYIHRNIQKILTQKRIPGLSVAVLKESETVLLNGYGFANIEHSAPATENTVYEIASVGKTFTAALTMMLVEEGVISLSDRINEYITDCLENPPAAWVNVTIKHILSHQSGIPSYTDAPNYWDITRIDLSKAEILSLVTNLPLKFPPGESISYDNTGYYLLGLMLEKVTGKTYSELLQERIFSPLGMNSTKMHHPRDIIPYRAAGYRWVKGRLINKPYYSPSVTYSGGGQISSVTDLVKWEMSLQNATLLKQSTLNLMWTPNYPIHNDSKLTSQPLAGLGWWIINYPNHKVVGHNGSILGFASNITRFIDDKITVIVLCNLDLIARPDAIAKKIANYYSEEIGNLEIQPPIK